MSDWSSDAILGKVFVLEIGLAMHLRSWTILAETSGRELRDLRHCNDVFGGIFETTRPGADTANIVFNYSMMNACSLVKM